MRNATHPKLISFCMIISGMLLVCSEICAASHYQVTLIGKDYVYAMGINNKNIVTGYVNPEDSWNNSYAFLWKPDSGMISIGGYAAYRINEFNQVAGQSGTFQAAVWENGSWIDQYGRQIAFAINDKGQIAGLISSQGGDYSSFRADDIYSQSTFVTLPKPSNTASEGLGINNNGEVVASGGPHHSSHGLFYNSDGQYKILNGLDNSYAYPRAINDKDQIAGESMVKPDTATKAVFWNSPDSIMEYMGTLGTSHSYAYAINNSGQAVGSSSNIAFIWTRQSGMRNLNDLIDPSSGITLTDARDISENGSIVAWGVDSSGITGSYLLTVSETNTPPIADAGPNQVAYAWIDGVAEVNLDGSASYDPNGNNLTYLWQWSIDGNDYEANGVNPTIELPVGQHTIELVVNNGFEDSEPNYVVVTVVEPNEGLLRVTPQVINRCGRQKFVTATLWLPKGITKNLIDNNSTLLFYPGGVKAVRQFITRGRRVCIFALLDKDEILKATGGAGPVEVYVAGQLKTGQYFYGSDTIRIINQCRWPSGWNMRDWFGNRRWHYPFAQNKPD
jgi:hypothetical protein